MISRNQDLRPRNPAKDETVYVRHAPPVAPFPAKRRGPFITTCQTRIDGWAARRFLRVSFQKELDTIAVTVSIRIPRRESGGGVPIPFQNSILPISVHDFLQPVPMPPHHPPKTHKRKQTKHHHPESGERESEEKATAFGHGHFYWRTTLKRYGRFHIFRSSQSPASAATSRRSTAGLFQRSESCMRENCCCCAWTLPSHAPASSSV